jgi:hypothetical protein
MDALKLFVSGVVLIGLATAVGLHGTGIASALKAGGTAGQGLLGTAETGNT